MTATQDKVYDVSYESALRQAGYKVTVVPNQGKGAAKQRTEAGRRLFPSIWFDEKRPALARSFGLVSRKEGRNQGHWVRTGARLVQPWR
jgi:hypothetical protein